MRIIVRIHPGHTFDPLGRHPSSRSIAAKAFDWLRNRADRTIKHHGEDTGAIILAEGIWAGELVVANSWPGSITIRATASARSAKSTKLKRALVSNGMLCTPVARTVFQIIVRCCM